MHIIYLQFMEKCFMKPKITQHQVSYDMQVITLASYRIQNLSNITI